MAGEDGPVDEGSQGEGRDRTSTLAAVVMATILLLAIVGVVIIRPDGERIERSTWAYELVQLDQARDLGLTGEGVVVGIVDTGIDSSHPSLKGINIIAWMDFVNGREGPYDDEGHGSSMASIIVGRDPIEGGALGVSLVIAKVVDSQGASTDTKIADGIDFCIDPDGNGDYSDGADIISLSLGVRMNRPISYYIGSKTQDAVSQAVSHGILVVAAAGNDGPGGKVSMPGGIHNVICVGAVDSRTQVAPFSSKGDLENLRRNPNKKPEVVAPGVDIVTAFPGEKYAVGSGTSQATAFVSAILAVALSANPQLLHNGDEGGTYTTVETVKTALMDSSTPLDGQVLPHDIYAGYGLAQAVDLARELGATV